ncbi:disease resistance protein RPM1-like [Pyrus ussuriensis x Pyrus communis]|uniref:Disease resistance protein RPM1-like n=1 Tax=Pyrus ussuriensis x Pyrus communis TaxID=2448454 RepID=A0A5N5I9B4_9ROSA|nr:disease resistance protein RPM1-like [Pyrus ussuriensis x Pyrus communis]
MAEIAVPVALFLADKVIIFLHRKFSRSNINNNNNPRYLERMRAYLSEYSSSEQTAYDEGFQVLQTRTGDIRNIAYELKTIKDIVDNKLVFLSTLDKIHQVSGRDQRSRPSSSTTRHGESTVTHHNQFLEEEEIVGFEEPKEKLISQLMEGDPNISLVGPGGSGKTTLLKNVFESKEVQRFFGCHAWIDVLRDLCARKLDELLLNMLSKFNPKGKRKESVTHEDPKAQLVRASKDKNKQDLKCIVDALPNGLPGSKIVITTRNSEVANVLSWERVWNLFCSKAFHNSKGKCPTQILDWEEKIVKKCESLPLAISAVGTLLAMKRPTPLDWKKLHDSLGSNVPIITQILQPSYKDLLKTCFLFFGMIPEDYSISRERLIRLRVAEGVVFSWEVPEGYLNELIGRNLVHVSSWEVDGRVRSFRVLNLVREFIIREAKDFITVLLAANCRGARPGEKIRHLSVHDVTEGNNFSIGFKYTTKQALKFFTKQALKFLRVLDLQGIIWTTFLILLRHTNIKKVPKSIKKLGFLETLDLKHTKVANLPKQIYKLHNLHHFLVYRYDVTNYVTFEAARSVEVSAGNISSLSSIQKLSPISVKNNRKIITTLRELKGLRKLGLTVLVYEYEHNIRSEDGRKLCCSLHEMEQLSTLDVRSTSEDEFLDLDHDEFQRLPMWISKLHSVAKIGLKWSKLQANKNPLEALQALPNLMELDLVQYHTSAELEFKANTFNMLRILHIEQFDQLNMVVVENMAMPKLEKLIMSRCQNLSLLPLGMEHLMHLDKLLLYDMPDEFIAKLGKDSEDCAYVEHIRVIHSFHLRRNQSFTGFQNLS